MQANVTVDPVWTNAKQVLDDIATFAALSAADQSRLLLLELTQRATAVAQPVPLLASGKVNMETRVKRTRAASVPWITSGGPTVCTDVELSMGTPTRSALGGLCCTRCGDAVCCPSKDMATGEDITLTLKRSEFLEHNLCCGPDDPEEWCVPHNIEPVMRVEGVQTSAAAPQVNLVVKSAGDYHPSWPQTSAAMGEVDGQHDVLSARRLGYLHNGRKSGPSLGETVQLNLCNGRAVGVDVCFEGAERAGTVDGPAGPVVMKKARIQLMDLDMGANQGLTGPEAVQFSCPGGQITLFGTPPWHTAMTPHTVDKGWFSVPGSNGTKLDRFIFDCPDHPVTFWSKKRGKASDNPITSNMSNHDEQTMNALILIEFVDTSCARFEFANMPPSYRQEPWKEKYEGTWYEYPGYPLAAAAAGGNPLNQVGLCRGESSPSPSP